MPDDLLGTSIPQEQAQPAQAAPAAAPPATAEPTQAGDPFLNVSREGMIHKYKELEQESQQSTEQFNQLGDFVRKVGPFFKVDGESVLLNEDMVKEYANQRGWLQHAAQDGPSANDIQQNAGAVGQTPAPENGEGFMDRLEQGGESAMRKIIQEEISKGLQENVQPHLKEFWTDRGERWMDRLKAKHPDFDNWRNQAHDYAKKVGFNIRSLEDMEKAYIAAKAIGGGYVDKKQHEALQQELQQTLQVVQPGGSGFNARAVDPEAPEDDLLGIDSIQNNPQAGQIAALFSKSALKP